MSRILFLCITALLVIGCANEKPVRNASASSEIEIGSGEGLEGREKLIPIDLKQDISKLSLQELRLLRNKLLARQGYLFMDADLRGYFSANYPWYDSLMEARFWAEETEEDADEMPPIRLNKEEQAFLKRIQKREAELQKNNYIQQGGYRLANAQNVINLYQFKDLKPDFMDKLAQHNFVIVNNDNIQLFHLYEENDYHQLPNFVTSDLFLQAFHMYFGYLLKSLEKAHFMKTIATLTEGLHKEALNYSKAAANPQEKKRAAFLATYYAIPHFIIAKKKLEVPENFREAFNSEIVKIDAAEDEFSPFLGVTKAYFPYSLFKPRGHYTRSDSLGRYFKAMMWLQTATFCREEAEQLHRTALAAALMEKSGMLPVYRSLYEPIMFLIGQPDNLSFMDVHGALKTMNKLSPERLTPETLENLNIAMEAKAKAQNRIRPKIELTCPDKINFMPQRYLPDNEVLQEMVDINAESKRPFPKGLDVFAAFGSEEAEQILNEELKEPQSWSEFRSSLGKMKSKFKGYDEWDHSVYNKWIESLLALQTEDKSYPPFMLTPSWDKKQLNTMLASWAELKHDAILYGEQPMAAECGGGGPPAPITVGYVEPNVAFWEKTLELIDLTENTLNRNKVLTEGLKNITDMVRNQAKFMLNVSRKELARENLTEEEFTTIEIIGSSFEYLTLSLIDPDAYFDSWENVKGPDRSVSVVADIYTRNILGSRQNGILHVGTGKVNDLYAIVEINGHLYLTKGAVLSYYEFVRPLGQRLTDEEWQKMLDNGQTPPAPVWLKDITLPGKNAPMEDERVFYSSGC